MNDDYPTFKGIGPTNEPRCPNCLNSLQNGIPHGSPELRLCATCKIIFSTPAKEVQEAINNVTFRSSSVQSNEANSMHVEGQS